MDLCVNTEVHAWTNALAVSLPMMLSMYRVWLKKTYFDENCNLSQVN